MPLLDEDALAQPCEASQSRPWRAVDWLLSGQSVAKNRHLSRFAAAPYLQRLLDAPEFSLMLNRSSKHLRKEIIEAYAVVDVVEAALTTHCRGSTSPPAAFVDLCSGKGFLSTVLALEFPASRVIMVDANMGIKTEHVDTVENLTFVRADIMSAKFESELAAALGTAEAAASADSRGETRRPCVAVGMHLCGLLSPRAVELFGATALLDVLVLVPCCLDKRTDSVLKAQARQRGVDPYDAKIEELQVMLRRVLEATTDTDGSGALCREAGCVEVVRDAAMRTSAGGEATEGSSAAKNALIIGTKPPGVRSVPAAGVEPLAWHGGLRSSMHAVEAPAAAAGPSAAERRRQRRAACRLEKGQAEASDKEKAAEPVTVPLEPSSSASPKAAPGEKAWPSAMAAPPPPAESFGVGETHALFFVSAVMMLVLAAMVAITGFDDMHIIAFGDDAAARAVVERQRGLSLGELWEAKEWYDRWTSGAFVLTAAGCFVTGRSHLKEKRVEEAAALHAKKD